MVLGQLVDGLQDNADGPVLFPDGLIVEFNTLQNIVELELFGEFIEEYDATLRSVPPYGALYGRFDELEHDRQYFPVVPDLVQLKDDQTLVLQAMGSVLSCLEEKTVKAITNIFGEDMQKIG